jgi:hypothetical protein
VTHTVRVELILTLAAVARTVTAAEALHFVDVSREVGLSFTHFNAATQEKYMVETMGSGGGFFDYDGDGDLDVYLLNGAPLPGSAQPNPPPTNVLFRNEGGHFVDVTALAGVGDTGYGMGLAAGDVDNDGDQDLYVTNFGPNVFYRNNGDGTFTEATERAGLGAGEWSASAAFGDYDDDGYLDLYLSRYVDFALDNHKFCGNLEKKLKAYCHPDVYNAVPGILYRGRGDGTFENVTHEAGVFEDQDSKSLGVVWADYDNDGNLDLYVANDSMRNFLYRNVGDGRFEDVTLLAGVGYSEDGQAQAGMGTDIADYDGDGVLDIVVTNLDFEYNDLYRGSESGIFTDESYSAGIAEVTLNFVGFGTFFFDFDNDGWRDIFVANGHIIDNIDQFGSVSTYRERNFLFRNGGKGAFEEIAGSLGEALVQENVARGAVPGDYDRDGDLDILITRCGGRVMLARNEGAEQRPSLILGLVGRTSNRDAIGARITLQVGERTVVGEVHSGRSYLSQGPLEVHFGLGEDDRAQGVSVRWPSGSVEELGSLSAGRYIAVEEAGVVFSE